MTIHQTTQWPQLRSKSTEDAKRHTLMEDLLMEDFNILLSI